jgi:hypothetical protein
MSEGRDDVDARPCERDRSARKQFEAGIVVDFVSGFHHARGQRCHALDGFFLFRFIADANRGSATYGVSDRRSQRPRGGLHDPAMSVRHVFAEANVAHQDQVWHFAFHGTCSPLHDAVVGPGSGGDVIFLVGKAEENHRRHAQGINLLCLFYRFVHREVEHAGHRADFLAHALTGANEHGVDKGLRSEAGFAHQIAKLRSAAETTKTGNRKGHGNHLARIERLLTLDSSRTGAAEGRSWVIGVRS